jgi:RimJ/RimL family protein N-acetyltransferase
MAQLSEHAITLSGERVVLRPMTEADWDLIYAVNNDPEVGYFSEEDEWHPYTMERLQEIYRGISRHALMFVMEHEGQPIGECWLQRMNVPRILEVFPGQDVRRIDLAIGAKHLWGQGLGSDAIRLLVQLAFEREGVDVLVCFTGGHNPRSRRAFEKAGFTVLRTLPGHAKAGFGDDLLLTREQYGRGRETHTAGQASQPIRQPPGSCTQATGRPM